MPGAGSDSEIEQAYTGYDASINAIVVAYRGTGQWALLCSQLPVGV